MNEAFLALLAPVSITGPVRLGGGRLEEIKTLAEKRGLLMLLQRRLADNKEVVEPAGEVQRFLKEMETDRFSGIARSVRQENIQREVSGILRGADIPSVVLRGNAIAGELYEAPYLRVSADIDLLVRMADVIYADTVLSSLGYRRDNSLPLKFWLNRIHHAVYVHPETGGLIELHWNFCIPSYFRLSSEEIWTEVISGDDGQERFSPEMMVIQLLTHHHMHAFRELKGLVDILWALHKYDGVIEWKTMAGRLKNIGLVKTTLITLNQLKSLWNDLCGRMNSTTILGQCLRDMGYHLPAYLGSYFRMDIACDCDFQSLKDQVMSRLVLDSPSVILASFVKSFFPMPDDIKALYDDRRNWMLPYNYSRFITWRLAEWKR